MDNHYVNLEVIRLKNGARAGDYFASLQVGILLHNAPGGNPQQAVLQAWTSYTNYLRTGAIIREQALNMGVIDLPAWPTRIS